MDPGSLFCKNKPPVQCIQDFQFERGINFDQQRLKNLGSIKKIFMINYLFDD